jgi:DNA-binding CsgD family transcriptional regulator
MYGIAPRRLSREQASWPSLRDVCNLTCFNGDLKKNTNKGEAAMSLTRRECEVLDWIAQGKSDWQIGQILSISAKTVNYHVENAKRKLGVATRIQAVVAAIRAGDLDAFHDGLLSGDRSTSRASVRPLAPHGCDCQELIPASRLKAASA